MNASNRAVRVAASAACALSLLNLVGCSPPDANEAFNHIDVQVLSSATSATDVSAKWVAMVESAQQSVHIAIPEGDDTALADALIAAMERGVEVEVVTDVDLAETPGISRLISDGVPVQLADAGMAYFDFGVNADVAFTSEQVRMTSAYAIADRQRFVAGSDGGSAVGGARVVIEGRGQRLIEDLLTEHVQLFGGADATAVTAFDAPQKSIADNRWLYPTQGDWHLQMWLGPQERVTKRMIDEVYGARANVWLLTDELANEGMARALQAKASVGFDVQVVVGPSFGSTAPGLARIFERETPAVDKRRVSTPRVPTVLIVDSEPAMVGGLGLNTKVYVLSHTMISSTRLWNAEPIPTDQLTDGVLWVVDDPGQQAAATADLIALFQSMRDQGSAL